jgi:uncharacterized protein YukE
MAKQVKVFTDDINTINSDLEKLIQELQQCYTNMENEKTMITEKWQSSAALKFINNIGNQNKKLKDAISKIEEAEKLVKTTSKSIRDVDKTIKNQFSSIIN